MKPNPRRARPTCKKGSRKNEPGSAGAMVEVEVWEVSDGEMDGTSGQFSSILQQRGMAQINQKFT